MTPLGWVLIGVTAVAAGVALCFAWYCASELDRVQRLHGHHVLPRPEYEPGPLALFFRRLRWQRKPAVPVALHPCCEHCEDGSLCEPRDSHREPCFDCPVPYVPADAQVQAPADAMHAQYAAWVYGVKPVRSEGPQPWATGAQDALTDEVEAAIEAAQEKRAQLASSVLRQLAAAHDDQQPTGDDMLAALVALRAVPVPDPYEAPAASAPAYGQVPVAEVLESERLADVMQQ
jgi:hypothetical protein